ncbi:MarR family winged helix-turn-helix transcriptional regulator [Luteimicrobium subarcticum]|uniref:DNA-binding MarR family transcriptional regulator n=1 Tax=Luteimicrobium subarcticum TaxID=620910 RepID=A0A2M8W471_9MICO|nr:MarR family transcriptional regulator [Luteimicrobium subarcticum]PJI85722.1 DNA-binding MarR family transcriptional regulator [Luteimicrobium subarcticum]
MSPAQSSVSPAAAPTDGAPTDGAPTVAASDDALVDALVQSAFMTTAVLSRVAAEHDLSLTLLRVLGILADRRLRISELADFLGLERSTLSGLVDRAERRGLVERTPSAADGRVVEVSLSAVGRAQHAVVHAQVAAALAPQTAVLSSADRRRLERLLTRSLVPAVGRTLDESR